MPGSGGSTSTEVNKDPWKPAEPYLKDIMQQGQNLYNSGTGSGVYQGPALAPMDPNTSMALGSMQNTALGMMGGGSQQQGGGGQQPGYSQAYQNAMQAASAPGAGTGANVAMRAPGAGPMGGGNMAAQPLQFGSNMMGSGGMTGAMNPALRTLGGVASGQNGIDTGAGYGDIANRAQGTNSDVIGAMGNIALGAGAPSAAGLTALDQGTRSQNFAPNWYMDNISSGNNGINTGGAYGTVASGAANPTASEGFNRGEFSATANAKTGPTYSENYLRDMAQGGGINPYLQNQMDTNARRISDQVASSMSGSGRYGSGNHEALLARSIGEANNPLMAQAYESDQNRRLSATGQMDQSRMGADATRLQALQGVLQASGQADTSRNAANSTILNALGGQTGVQGQNISNEFNAAQGAANSRRADTGVAAGLLGQIANTQGQAIGNQIQAGQTMAGLRNQNLATEMGALGGQTATQQANIGNQTGAATGMLNQYGQGLDRAATWANMAPQNNALQYDPAMRLGQVGGYMEGRSQAELDAEKARFQQEQQSPWTQLSRYGGAVSGLGGIIQTGGQTNAQQQNTAPWFGPLGLIPGFGQLLGSDREMKTDIKKLGENDPDTGLPLYAYRYKGDSKNYPKVIGPMAQDAAKVYPDKVHRVGGLLAIEADLMPRKTTPGLLGAL